MAQQRGARQGDGGGEYGEEANQGVAYESGEAIDREYEARLHDYYGYPYYWV